MAKDRDTDVSAEALREEFHKLGPTALYGGTRAVCSRPGIKELSS